MMSPPITPAVRVFDEALNVKSPSVVAPLYHLSPLVRTSLNYSDAALNVSSSISKYKTIPPKLVAVTVNLNPYSTTTPIFLTQLLLEVKVPTIIYNITSLLQYKVSNYQ